MKVHLATANNAPWSRINLDEMTEIARADRWGVHTLTDSSEEADILFFTDAAQLVDDWSMSTLRNNPLVRRFPDKVFVYDERDVPRELFPGVFVSMPKTRFDASRQRVVSYFQIRNAPDFAPPESADLLFSFQGRRAGSIRGQILDLKNPRALIEDTSALNFFGAASEHIEERRRLYRETLQRSKFVLCPRGAGTSSYRLFETLAAGRIPVVIADEYVWPQGIEWDKCSVQIPESHVAQISKRLEAKEADFPAMSAVARRVYEDHFAYDSWFHRAIEACAQLKQEGAHGPKRFFWFDARVGRDALRAGGRCIKSGGRG